MCCIKANHLIVDSSLSPGTNNTSPKKTLFTTEHFGQGPLATVGKSKKKFSVTCFDTALTGKIAASRSRTGFTATPNTAFAISKVTPMNISVEIKVAGVYNDVVSNLSSIHVTLQTPVSR